MPSDPACWGPRGCEVPSVAWGGRNLGGCEGERELETGTEDSAWVRGRREDRRPSHLSASERSSQLAGTLRGRPRDRSGKPARQHPDPKSRSEMNNQPKNRRDAKRHQAQGQRDCDQVGSSGLVRSRSSCKAGRWMRPAGSMRNREWRHRSRRLKSTPHQPKVRGFHRGPDGEVENAELLVGRLGFETDCFRTQAPPGPATRIIAGGAGRRRGAQGRVERSLFEDFDPRP